MPPTDPLPTPPAGHTHVGYAEGTVAIGGNVEMRGQNVAGRDIHVEQHVHLPQAPSFQLFQLPPDVEDFVDREQEILGLREQLERPPGRAPVVSVIVGRAGVGKTALAIRVANEVREQVPERFPEGLLYVDLRGAEPQPLDPADVLADFLRALGVADHAIPARIDARTGLYRTRLAARRVLIVLDNAATEAQVRPLLPGTASSAVLVTSRTRLAGLTMPSLTLSVLDRDHAVKMLETVARRDVAAGEREHATTIAESCGCLPLAMRIAGAKLANMEHLQLSELAEQLKDERGQLEKLRVGDLEVRATLQASYDNLLRDEQRRAFRLLGLIDAVDFPVWVAAALLGLEPRAARALLDRLVDVQLLDRKSLRLEATGDKARDAARYRFHDLVRALARERLEQEDSHGLQRSAIERMLHAYLEVAETADACYDPTGAEQRGAGSGWLAQVPDLADQLPKEPGDWYATELASLVAAVEKAEELEDWNLVLRLAAAQDHFLSGASRWSDWKRTQGPALRAARHRTAEALHNLGNAYWEQGRWDEAVRSLEQSLELFQELGDLRAEATTRQELGRELREQSRWEPAIHHLEAALHGFEELGDKVQEASTRRSLGRLYLDQGRLEEAREHVVCAHRVLRKHGNLYEQSHALRDVGLNRRARKEPGRAIRSLERAIKGFGQLGNWRYVLVTRFDVGTVYYDQGRYDEARARFDEAQAQFHQMGDRRWEAMAVTMLGKLDHVQGQHEEALKRFEQALSQFRDLGDRRWEATTLYDLGNALHASGQVDSARSAWSKALDIFMALELPGADEVRAALAGSRAGDPPVVDEGQQRPQPPGQPPMNGATWRPR